MSELSTVLIFCFIGVLGARQPDVDINRIQLLPDEEAQGLNPTYYSNPSFRLERLRLTNDYDDLRVGSTSFHPASEFLQDTATSPETKKTIAVHQPREDPKLFYQSNSYLKEYVPMNIKKEVSEIYPGREVVRAEEMQGYKPIKIVSRKDRKSLPMKDSKLCVKCPHDRVMVAKAGSDRTILKSPRLLTCNGRKAPKSVQFTHMYGPQFGSLLEKGSHMVMGHITFRGKSLKMCKMQVEVMVQSCPFPKYLIANCDGSNKTCNFSCRDKKLELHGQSSAVCGDDMKWNSTLPICTVRDWCELPPPPRHGHISCKGNSTADGLGLEDGAKCHVLCVSGWKWKPRVATVCRRGTWTRKLLCQKSHHKRSHT